MACMKAIVTTTINPPTEAIEKFADKKEWQLYIVGDLKTPENDFLKLNAIYISPKEQEEKYKELSDLIGWNCIQRRNIGLIQAYRDGAEIIATVDDDNIPYDNWGENLLIGKELEADCYENINGIFDPLSVTNISEMWHRGYPVQFLSTRTNNKFVGKKKIVPQVQVDLWDGEPDIDAICRLVYDCPSVKITGNFPYTFNGLTVFNSQNTFFHRSIIPYYTVIAGADRMDDIWGGILLQKKLNISIVFNSPSVYQKRNPHDIVNDMERELAGHYHTLNLIQKTENKWCDFYECYQKNCFKTS
jgi:hypothetical protein